MTGLSGLGGLSGLVRSGGAAPAYLLRDTFTDTNGTALASHTMDVGAGWTTAAGWEIQGNAANRTVTGYAWADAGVSDIVVVVTVTAMASYAAVVARVSDLGNLWLAEIGGGSITLYERVAGVFTQRGVAASNPTTPFTLSVRCVGTTITVAVNGADLITYGSATFNQTATRFGIGTSTGVTTLRFDDFEVTAP